MMANASAEDKGGGADAARPAEVQRLFVFSFAGQNFAVPLNAVVEIVETSGVETYPGDLPHCRGTTNHRGRILPVFDPHGLSFGCSAPDAAPSGVVVLASQNACFGLILERHLELLELPVAAVPTTGGDTTEDDTQAGIGMLPYRDAAMALISPEIIAGLVTRKFGAQTTFDADRHIGEAESSQQWEEFILSRIGGASIAHPVNGVLEIVEGLDVMPLFSVDPCLRGLTNLRGRVLSCIDISEVIGLPPRLLDDRSMFLVLSAEGAEFALCVDDVLGIRTLPAGIFAPSGGLLQPPAEALFNGVAEHDGDTLLELTASAIVKWDRLAPLRINTTER